MDLMRVGKEKLNGKLNITDLESRTAPEIKYHVDNICGCKRYVNET
jgi:hypothetical protein